MGRVLSAYGGQGLRVQLSFDCIPHLPREEEGECGYGGLLIEYHFRGLGLYRRVEVGTFDISIAAISSL